MNMALYKCCISFIINAILTLFTFDLRSDGLNAISPTDWAPKYSPAKLAYSLDGSRCSCHAYHNVSNTNLSSITGISER